MKKVLKKIISIALAAVLMVSGVFVLSSCSNKKALEVAAIGTFEDGNETKGSWITKLSERVGLTEYESSTPAFSDVKSDSNIFPYVQACCEWDVLEAGGLFNENDNATMEFIAVTAMKSIGIEKLNKSDLNVNVSTNEDLINLFSKNVYKISDINATISASIGSMILSDFIEFSNSLSFEPIHNIEYTSSVNQDFSLENISVVNGQTATVSDASGLSVNDIVIVNPSEEYPEGAALKVESISGNSFTYSTPSIQEVCDGVQLQGTYQASIINVIDGDDTDIVNASYDENGSYNIEFVNPLFTEAVSPVEAAKINTGKSKTVSAGPISAKFSISDIEVTPDIDVSWLGGVKSADVKTTVSASIEGKLKGEAETKSVDLFTLQCQLGSTPFAAEITVSAKAGVDGELTVTYTAALTASAEYKKGAKPKMTANAENSLEVDGHVTAYVNVTPTISLLFLGQNLINVGATVGANANATLSGDLLDKDEAICANVLVYISLKLGVNQRKSWTSSLLDCNKTIWDSSTSLFKWEFHYEYNQNTNEFSKVDSCTRGNEEVLEDAEENLSHEKDVVEEYFEGFKSMENKGGLALESTDFSLEKGESKNIVVVAVPEGYSDDDLVYESNKPNVVSVNSSGLVKAISSGSASITIKTKDEKYITAVTVTVEEEYAEFSSIDLSTFANNFYSLKSI